MREFGRSLVEGFRRGWTKFCEDPYAQERQARYAEYRRFLEEPKLGAWRRKYVAFFLEHSRPGTVRVDPLRVDAFTDQLLERHRGVSRETLEQALNSLHGRFVLRDAFTYTLYHDHKEALWEADRLMRNKTS